MDSKLILVTGGARSGKSSFSERLILESCRRPAYVATCPVLDAETAERIRPAAKRATGSPSRRRPISPPLSTAPKPRAPTACWSTA